MSIEENKAMVHRVIEEAVNQRNLATLNEIMAPNYVYHDFKVFKRPEGFKEMLGIWYNAFSDLHVTIKEMVAEGEKVAVFFSFQGTHKGEMMGIPPTGKKIDIPEVDLVRFDGGKEVEGWPLMDRLIFFQQLGISPPSQ